MAWYLKKKFYEKLRTQWIVDTYNYRWILFNNKIKRLPIMLLETNAKWETVIDNVAEYASERGWEHD